MKEEERLRPIDRMTRWISTGWIYALVDPGTGDIRYIGKTTDPYCRCHQHENIDLCHKGNVALMKWKRELHDRGVVPEFKIIAEITAASDWLLNGLLIASEQAIIEKLSSPKSGKRINNLLNVVVF